MPPRRSIFAAVALGLICVSAGPAACAESATADAQVRLGESHLEAAATGVAGAADRALAAFDAALAAAPGNHRARAGRGLALIAQAMAAPVTEKLALARRGCAELDAAIAAAPDDAALRLMRATSAVKMPRLLDRAAIAESDFARLLADARDDRVTMAPETRRGIFYQAAAFLLKERRTGAVDLLEQAASIDAVRPTDDQVQSLLELARRHTHSSTHADLHPPAESPAP